MFAPNILIGGRLPPCPQGSTPLHVTDVKNKEFVTKKLQHVPLPYPDSHEHTSESTRKSYNAKVNPVCSCIKNIKVWFTNHQFHSANQG